jgi:hypothetical protein
MSNNINNNNNNFLDDNDKDSVNSDISNNTDIKVFHGAINANNFLVKTLGKTANKKEYKNIFNLDKEDNYIGIKNNNNNNNNGNNKGNISVFKINQINNNKLNSNSNNSNNNFNNNNKNEIIPPQIKPKLKKKLKDNNNNNNNNINNDDNNNEILSFRNELSSQFLFSNQSNYPLENNTNNNNKKQLLLKFKDITKEDEEIMNNGFIPTIDENKKKSFQHLTNSQTSFKIATIEKGIALLVSSEDCIFTMPTFLLPKNCKIGTTYTFLIEEMNKTIQIKHKINVLQKNYLKNYNNNNNINN